MGWEPPSLAGRVAVVTGATRGVGKGVALALGDCGATVYVTGRSTVAETAAEVDARGGQGLAVRTDHTDDRQVEALFWRVGREARRLDVLVCNAWGGYEGGGYEGGGDEGGGDEGDDDGGSFDTPSWEQPVSVFDVMVGTGLRAAFTAARAAAPLLVEQGHGLVVCTGGWAASDFYLGNLAYDVVKAATARLVVGLAHELRPHGVAVVGVYPGFTRTEAVVAAYAAKGLEPPPETHSPEFVGRAIAALAADPAVAGLSGTGAQAAVWAQRYGFTDIDGRQIAPFELPEAYRL